MLSDVIESIWSPGNRWWWKFYEWFWQFYGFDHAVCQARYFAGHSAGRQLGLYPYVLDAVGIANNNL
jgi:hypothetical protein